MANNVIIIDSSLELEAVCERLPQAAQNHQFGVLGSTNLREKMQSKGVDFQPECRVFDVCNPHKAKEALETEMAVSSVLPCRISIYQEDGKVKLATMKPTQLLGLLNMPKMQPVAAEVEDTMVAIMREAAR